MAQMFLIEMQMRQGAIECVLCHMYNKECIDQYEYSSRSLTALPRQSDMSHVVRKPVFGVPDQVQHKPGCTTTEDGWRLEISYLGSRGIVLSM